jgi:hypothetical protein
MVLRDGVEVSELYRIASEQNVQIRKLQRRHDSLETIFLRAMDTDTETVSAGAANGRL